MWRAALLSAGIALLASSSTAQEARVGVDDARELIFVLLQQNQPAAAADAAKAVLAARENDVTALLGLSQAQLALGMTEEAAKTGRRAWAFATKPADKFASAMVAAQALARDDRKLLAQFWLRRAFQNAPSGAAKAAAARDMVRLRSITPLHVDLDFKVEPSSNVNGGARSARVLGGTISGTALALSGVVFTGSAAATYSLPRKGRTQHALIGKVIWQTVDLSDEAQTIAPEASGSDFQYQELELGWRAIHNLERGQLFHTLTFGHSWSGSTALARFGGVSVGWTQPIGAGHNVTVTYQFEEQDRIDTPIRSSTLNAFSFGLSQTTRAGKWSLSAHYANKSSDSAIVDNVAKGIAASFEPRGSWMGTRAKFTAIYENRDFEIPIIFGFREDDTFQIAVDVTFPNINYYGFAPTLDLTARRNESSIDIYDSDKLSVGFGLTSLF